MLSMAHSREMSGVGARGGALSTPSPTTRQRGSESCRDGSISMRESPVAARRDYVIRSPRVAGVDWTNIQYSCVDAAPCHPSCPGSRKPGRAAGGGARDPQRRPARRGAARRRRRPGAGAAGPAPAAGDRRRRLGQDQHAGAPRGAPDRRRRRPAAHAAADLFAPRGAGDGAPRRPACCSACWAWPRRRRRRCPGPAPSMASAPGCCASTRRRSAWTRTSPSTTAATPRT